jgi:hypothetical protein
MGLFVAACAGVSGNRSTGLSASCELDSYDEFWSSSSRLTRQWNYRSAEIIEAYIDDSVSVEQYLRTSRAVLPDLEDHVAELRALSRCLATGSEERMFGAVVSSYERKLTGYVHLENSVRLGDIDGEQRAIEILMQAQQTGMDALCAWSEEAGAPLPIDFDC